MPAVPQAPRLGNPPTPCRTLIKPGKRRTARPRGRSPFPHPGRAWGAGTPAQRRSGRRSGGDRAHPRDPRCSPPLWGPPNCTCPRWSATLPNRGPKPPSRWDTGKGEGATTERQQYSHPAPALPRLTLGSKRKPFLSATAFCNRCAAHVRAQWQKLPCAFPRSLAPCQLHTPHCKEIQYNKIK